MLIGLSIKMGKNNVKKSIQCFLSVNCKHLGRLMEERFESCQRDLIYTLFLALIDSILVHVTVVSLTRRYIEDVIVTQSPFG